MKIFCTGRNYHNHIKELGNAVPEEPLIFMKPPTALLRNGKPFYIPSFSNEIHYEAELVVKIAKTGKYINKDNVRSFYDELTIGIDFTARDLQRKLKSKGYPWEIAKGFDFSAAIGNWIPFTGEMKEKNINFSLKKNNETVQSGNSTDMIFNIDTLILYISKFFKLQKGDLLFTGTPAGVGKVSAGDVLEGFIFDKEYLYCEIR